MLDGGSLAERIRAELLPIAGDEEAFGRRLREIYGELADCLLANQPWSGRDL
jgi:hypothetical protein